MPMFEYVCKDCETEFEKLVRNTSKTEINCPSCESDRVQKKMSTFAAKIVGQISISSSASSAGSCAPSGGG